MHCGVQIAPYQGVIFLRKDVPGHARRHCAVSCAKMADRIEMPFGLWDSGGPKDACNSNRWNAHWRYLANTIEPSMCDAAFLSNYFDHLLLLLSLNLNTLEIIVYVSRVRTQANFTIRSNANDTFVVELTTFRLTFVRCVYLSITTDTCTGSREESLRLPATSTYDTSRSTTSPVRYRSAHGLTTGCRSVCDSA